MTIIGSCNSLLFFLLQIHKDYLMTQRVYFGNPLLGEYALLAEFKRVKRSCQEEYLLGFVPSTNKIKLLKIKYCGYREVGEAHILTFREDDKWRKLKDPLSLSIRYSRGICFNGAYHWASDDILSWICTFDFEEEKCGRISSPHGLPRCKFEMRITVLNNHLCLIEQHSFYGAVTLWTMKEYGVAESWSMKEYGVAESWSQEIMLNASAGYMPLSRLFPYHESPVAEIFILDTKYTYFLSCSRKTKKWISVNVYDGHLQTNGSVITTYAPRFYALEKDVSVRKCSSTGNGSCVYVPSGISSPSVNKFCDFVRKLWNKLGF